MNGNDDKARRSQPASTVSYTSQNTGHTQLGVHILASTPDTGCSDLR